MKTNINPNFPIIVVICSYMVFLIGCSKKDNTSNSDGMVPVVQTAVATNITSNSALSGGNITSDAGSVVTARGVCWAIGKTPTISNNKTLDGNGAGNYSSNITGLNPDTTYFIRAYATNKNGTGYGNTLSFRTISQLPLLTTTAMTNIKANSAVSGGTITYDGDLPIVARGVCWSLNPVPSITDSKTVDGTGSGSFTSNLTNLSIDTTWYVRAYATNSAGTGYGNTISFRTIPTIGQNYQGGIVAYIIQQGDPGYVAGHSHGLIAAPTDQSTGIVWYGSSSTMSIPTSMGLGTGMANTETIIAAIGSGTYAAELCHDLVLGGHSDWYLPSYDELYKLYLNKDLIGGFTTTTEYGDGYWSSYMDTWDVYSLFFSDGYWQRPPQNFPQRVRAIRSF